MNYIDYPAASYSSFSRWLKSPDLALMPFRESEATLLGKCFEDHLETVYTGKENEWIFADVTGMTLISAINNPIEKPRANKHNEALDFIKNNKKVAPVNFKDVIDAMLCNIEKAEITKGIFEGLKANEILNCEYQIESYGEIETYENVMIPVKAKFDIVSQDNIFDIKTTSNIEGFRWQYKDGYWIQDYIYSHLGKSPLIFLVVETVEPYTSKFIYRNGDFEVWQNSKIKQLAEYWIWKMNGKKPQGFRETELL